MFSFFNIICLFLVLYTYIFLCLFFQKSHGKVSFQLLLKVETRDDVEIVTEKKKKTSTIETQKTQTQESKVTYTNTKCTKFIKISGNILHTF